MKKANKKKGKKSGGNEEVLDNGQVVKIWEVISRLKMSVISLTERFENMTETEGVDIIKELPQAQLYEAKAKTDDLQSLNCALENMELKNQVTRLIKDNYELAQCLKSFTEDDLKSQGRLDLAPQPPEPGSVHVSPADCHQEQKRENKADQKILTYPPSSKKLKQSTQTCAQQKQPKSNKQQQILGLA